MYILSAELRPQVAEALLILPSQALQARRPEKSIFFSSICRAKKVPPVTKIGLHGLRLGCGSQLDAGREKKPFFGDVRKKNWPKTGKKSSDGRALHRNRSGVVKLVEREPLMFAQVENGVTKSCQNFIRKNRKNAILA
tara:strand:+ start:21 stop:434 length:414 start_codon:yes stop_codon:yes gene_type:complete